MPTFDQRGTPFTRVYDGRIDIGAIEQQPTEFMLGDFDRSSTVTAADYVLWRKARGTTDGLGFRVDQRGNADGIVDDWDYNLWRQNFGRTISISEPPLATGPTADGASSAFEQPAIQTEVSARDLALAERVDKASVGRNAPFAPARRDALVAWLAPAGDVRTATRDELPETGDSRSPTDEQLSSLQALDEALATLERFADTSRFAL